MTGPLVRDWQIVRRVSVMGAQVVVLEDASSLVATIARYAYPTGKVLVRVGFDFPGRPVYARAEAVRLLAELYQSIGDLEAQGASPELEAEPAIEFPAGGAHALVDVRGPGALALVLPFFGDGLVDPITAHLIG